MLDAGQHHHGGGRGGAQHIMTLLMRRGIPPCLKPARLPGHHGVLVQHHCCTIVRCLFLSPRDLGSAGDRLVVRVAPRDAGYGFIWYGPCNSPCPVPLYVLGHASLSGCGGGRMARCHARRAQGPARRSSSPATPVLPCGGCSAGTGHALGRALTLGPGPDTGVHGFLPLSVRTTSFLQWGISCGVGILADATDAVAIAQLVCRKVFECGCFIAGAGKCRSRAYARCTRTTDRPCSCCFGAQSRKNSWVVQEGAGGSRRESHAGCCG